MRYRFGDFELDSGRFALFRNGEPVAIEPKPLQLLLHLLERHPDTCSKDELLDALWPEAIVTEASLTRAVRAVRRALQEGAEDGGVIRTVRGHGYGIGVEIDREPTAPEPEANAPGRATGPVPPVASPPTVSERLEEEAPRPRRRLAAVLSADAVGYRRLVERSETAAVRALEAARSLMAQAVEEHAGRVVDTAGDDLLAELPSALDAVQAAKKIQSLLAKWAEPYPEEERLRFRIGLHAGDVTAHGDRIQGAGVLVAEDLARHAPAGGLCLSAEIVSQVRGQVDLALEAMEEQVDGGAGPISGFRVDLAGTGSPWSVSGPASARGIAWPGALARFTAVDRAILLLGVPVWILCFALGLQAYVEGRGYPPIGIPLATGVDEYPIVEILAPIVSFEGSDLRVGDRLVRVGTFDLKGASSLRFLLRFVEATEGGGSTLEVEIDRAGKRSVTTVPTVPLRMMAPVVLTLGPAFLVLSLLLVLRSPRDRITRALFHGGFFLSLAFVSSFGGSPAETGLSVAIAFVAMMVAPPMLFRFLAIFPRGRPIVSPWLHAGIWCTSLAGLPNFTMVRGFPFSMALGVSIMPPLFAATLAGALALLTSSYIRANPLQRRQLKWVVYGAYVGVLPPAFMFGWFALSGGDMQDAFLSQVSFVLIPIAVYLAIERANLFDIDRLISSTVSYNLLGIVLVAGALLLAPSIATRLADVVGIDPSTGQTALSLLFVGLAVPTHRILRPRVEAVLFHDRHAFDIGVGELVRQLSQCPDPSSLAERTGEGLNALVRPESCALYARDGEAYVALFAEGHAVPPAFQADSLLVRTLCERSSPLVLDDRAARRGAPLAVDPFDRAALETLGAHVVLPITHQGELSLVLSLGPKRSGDVYTPTDVALLTSIAQTASLALAGFDQTRIASEARRMEQALRRYVPGAVANQIEQGHELEAAAREVTVLFVDIRGYTALSENRVAEDIFGTVNDYTKRVSEIASAHGGSVVEFNGDGMMVVFGAPESLPDKEREALAAAREIVRNVKEIEWSGEASGALDVGIGIATGLAFVGNIRAADRLIWSAIGNTTNLAARLQALSRELDAAIVIDAATRDAAGEEALDFTAYLDTEIRGRSEHQDVHALGRGAPDSSLRSA